MFNVIYCRNMEINDVIHQLANFNWFEFFGCVFYIVSVCKNAEKRKELNY